MAMAAPRSGDYALLLALAAIWGGSFMLIKVAVDTVPPVTMTVARVGIGAVLFVAIVLATGRRLPCEAKVWGTAALAGLFGLALPFSLISWGEVRIEAGLAAILMAGMPLVTLILASFGPSGEPLTASKLLGVGFGIVGLVILIGPSKLTGLDGDLWRQLAIVAASFSYAVNAVVQKRIAGHDPYVVSAAIMLCAAAMLLPVSLAFEAPWTLAPSGTAWFALLMLGLLPTGVASLLMLAILRRQGAGFFAQINFLVPIFGVAWSFVVLSERPPASALAALAVILAGVGDLARQAVAAAPFIHGVMK
jgi:drug/metabolite transporter (DMT)-like permease